MSTAAVAKFYPAYDVPVPKKRNFKPKPAKLRQSITPGTVLIVLAGRFRGKRVIFLKQLPSGLLLVTGPYKVNGVPIRRINQAYVLPTSTKVNIAAVKLEKFDDKYFTEPASKAKQNKELYHTQTPVKVEIPATRKADQTAVDASLLTEIKKDALLKSYLTAKFSLTNGQYPHAMKF